LVLLEGFLVFGRGFTSVQWAFN